MARPASHPRFSQALRRLLLPPLPVAVALALVLAACGPSSPVPEAPSARAVLQRLELRTAADVAPVAPTAEVFTFDLLDGSEDWVIEAPERSTIQLAGAPAGSDGRLVQLKASATSELLRVARRGALDPAGFNELSVPLIFNGHGAVRVEFHRDGEIAAQTEATLLHTGTELVTITVPIPLDVRAAGPFDAVALRLDGDKRSYTLRGFSLRRTPAASLLPDPAAPPELLLVEGEARRGVGVCAGRDVTADVRVPAEAWLSWSYAQPPEVRRLGTGVTLEVSVEAADGGAPPLRERVVLERALGEPSRWRTGRLSLAALAGRDVRITFRCVADDGGEAGCVVAEAALARPAAPGPELRRPHVLLVTTDTHRGDHLGAAGAGVELDTPALDALAARGVLYTDAFAPANVTNPSHMALMTGVHPRDLGILQNVTALSDEAPTLAEAFRDAGFATWAIVSTEHLGPRGSGLGQGFDRASWPPYVPRRSGESVDLLQRWLAEDDGRPLFVWLHVFDAHWKYEPPEDFDRLYYPRGKDPRDPSLPPLPFADSVLPPDMAGLRDLDYPRAQYRAEIASQDHELARVLDAGPLSGALTAFVGDHGECLGEHGIWFNHDGLYPETLHIPLILAPPRGVAAAVAGAASDAGGAVGAESAAGSVAAPGSDGAEAGPGSGPAAVRPGTRVGLPVSHLDVARTLLDLAGLPDVDFPGRRLPLAGAETDSPPRFALASGGLAASLTWRGQHLILSLAGYRTPRMERAVAKHQTELYDLRADPGCERDLAESQPEAARMLRARLVTWLREAADLGWAGAPGEGTANLAGLEQLGYTGGTPGPVQVLWTEDDCAWCRRFR